MTRNLDKRVELMIISEHKPRKGTETCHCPQYHTENIVLFQNTNPERGRKLKEMMENDKTNVGFQNTNPERGRKRRQPEETR